MRLYHGTQDTIVQPEFGLGQDQHCLGPIVDAIPPEWLCEAYPGLHDLDLAQAVEKVAKERMKK